jgi:hypothetical protein
MTALLLWTFAPGLPADTPSVPAAAGNGEQAPRERLTRRERRAAAEAAREAAERAAYEAKKAESGEEEDGEDCD